ncbi:hypothetical protein F2Q70_00016402 [Brassica cretica]|uniref:Uncharacterized protein n=1 Tax=Brassica cretica TaxID=69181 RepID=A0A8S9I5V6_BRACR|nr:hypothetical protein F2Q70_00016402 [Brassica cretica]KAF2596960.1 hypothetical protein F2Q68_00009368 [Brassica cretica]
MEVSGKKAMTGLEATTAKLEATVKTEHDGGPEHGQRRSEQDNEDLCLTRRRLKKLGRTRRRLTNATMTGPRNRDRESLGSDEKCDGWRGLMRTAD